jgi:UDP-N-acetylmuramoyl-L-alanyl-D-glutamate--2,6-diaminopimelate ligase
VGYGLYGKCDVTARQIELLPESSKFLLITPKGNRVVNLRVPGIHNIYNALAAVAWGIAHKLDFESIIKGIEDFKGIPGIDIEIQTAENITIELVELDEVSRLREIYDSIKNLPKDKIATILCLDDNIGEETFSSLKSLVIQYSGFCIITCDYLSCVANMEKVVPVFLKELEAVETRYDLDHYKAIQKMIARLKGGGHILIVKGK